MCKSDPPDTLKTRLARVVAQAQDVFESADTATSWQKRPNRGLNVMRLSIYWIRMWGQSRWWNYSIELSMEYIVESQSVTNL
jgi:hypothetical protein